VTPLRKPGPPPFHQLQLPLTCIEPCIFCPRFEPPLCVTAPSVMRNGPPQEGGRLYLTYFSSGPAMKTCLVSNEVSRWQSR
jgi:hypothetical protein